MAELTFRNGTEFHASDGTVSWICSIKARIEKDRRWDMVEGRTVLIAPGRVVVVGILQSVSFMRF